MGSLNHFTYNSCIFQCTGSLVIIIRLSRDLPSMATTNVYNLHLDYWNAINSLSWSSSRCVHSFGYLCELVYGIGTTFDLPWRHNPSSHISLWSLYTKCSTVEMFTHTGKSLSSGIIPNKFCFIICIRDRATHLRVPPIGQLSHLETPISDFL